MANNNNPPAANPGAWDGIPDHVRQVGTRVGIVGQELLAFNRLVHDNDCRERCKKLLKAVYIMPPTQPPSFSWASARNFWALAGDEEPAMLMEEMISYITGQVARQTELGGIPVLGGLTNRLRAWQRCCALLRAHVEGRDGGEEALMTEARQNDREDAMVDFLRIMRLFTAVPV